MTDTAPTPASTWPLAPGEHPDLPRLVLELHEGHPETRIPGRRQPIPARAPHARLQWSPVRVLDTGNPDRLRGLAAQLTAAADALEDEHRRHAAATGQLDLDGRP